MFLQNHLKMVLLFVSLIKAEKRRRQLILPTRSETEHCSICLKIKVSIIQEYMRYIKQSPCQRHAPCMIYGQGGISIMIRKYGNLVRLKDLDDDFFIDLRYSTPDNFTGEVVYDFRECYVDESTAHRLIQAKDLLKRRGFGLKIWDAYRPVSAQRQFWNLCPDNNFVDVVVPKGALDSLEPGAYIYDLAIMNSETERILTCFFTKSFIIKGVAHNV